MTKAAEKEIITKPGSELSVVDLDINSKKIAELRQRYANLDEDLKDEENYRKAQDIINEARGMRSIIKTKGKGLKDDANKWQKKVVAEVNRLDCEITDFLDPLAARKKTHDDEVKAEKERKAKAEQLRKDTHLANINGIRLFMNEAQGQSSEKIEAVIYKLELININDTNYEEFQTEAEDVYEDIMLALGSLLIKTQTTEEADRKRIEEDERLALERKILDDEKAENERIRLKNAEVTRQNETAAQKIIDDKAAADKKAAEPTPSHSPAPGCSAASSVSIPPAAQRGADEDNSVIALAERNTVDAIFNVIADGKFLNERQVAESILKSIRAGDIPNLKYDIY